VPRLLAEPEHQDYLAEWAPPSRPSAEGRTAGADNGDPGAAEKVTTIISLCMIRGYDVRKFRDS
jgi:hypothetical protein